MELSGEYTFDAPQAMVWAAVQDPEVLASILPGGEGFETVGENEYVGNLKIKVGPVQGKFKGNIKLSNIVAPQSYDIDVDGKGAPGFVKANGSLKLHDAGDKTLMAYHGTANVGGRIASVGQRLLDASAKSIVHQSLEALNAYLKVQVERAALLAAPVAPPPAAEPAAPTRTAEPVAAPAFTQATAIPEYKAPSQIEFALKVGQEVYEDLVPATLRPVVTSVLTTLLTLLIVRILFGRRGSRQDDRAHAAANR